MLDGETATRYPRTMEQHVISAWWLRAFARRVGRQHLIHVYDKWTDTYDEVSVDDFLAETDAHSPAVERDIGRFEAPAAEAARRIAKLAKPVRPGLYAIGGPEPAVVGTDQPALTDVGDYHGIRLLVGEHAIPPISHGHRLALARYAALMYRRAPKVEAATVEYRDLFDKAAQAVVDRMMPGLTVGGHEGTSARRARMLTNVEEIGSGLAASSWWIVRATKGEAFILSDNPIATTVSLGHDDSWRAILSGATFVVVMPLGPLVALLMAPRVFIPITGIKTAEEMPMAINRLVWRSAGRFVLARTRTELDSALPGADEGLRRATTPVDYGAERVVRTAMGSAVEIVARAKWRRDMGAWRRWEGCRITFGYVPWASEDRDSILGPARHSTRQMRGRTMTA